jgi:hypothetical protein
MTRVDLGALAVFGAIAWEYDNPWYLAMGGLFVAFLGPLFEAAGRAAGRATSRRLRRGSDDEVRLP